MEIFELYPKSEKVKCIFWNGIDKKNISLLLRDATYNCIGENIEIIKNGELYILKPDHYLVRDRHGNISVFTEKDLNEKYNLVES